MAWEQGYVTDTWLHVHANTCTNFICSSQVQSPVQSYKAIVSGATCRTKSTYTMVFRLLINFASASANVRHFSGLPVCTYSFHSSCGPCGSSHLLYPLNQSHMKCLHINFITYHPAFLPVLAASQKVQYLVDLLTTFPPRHCLPASVTAHPPPLELLWLSGT